MAYKRMGLNDLIEAVQKRIKEKTGMECYDAVPDNAPSPFYFVEAIKSVPANSKTTYQDIFTIWIHIIAEPGDSSVQVNNLIQSAQQAMTDDIKLQEPFAIVLQVDGGVQTIKQDETKEKHAIIAYDLLVSYGMKCK